MFQDVSIDLKYEFKIFLNDLMLADGVIDDNEFKIFNSISNTLNINEDLYLDNLFLNEKKLKKLKCHRNMKF
jgi:hypothetical protein